MENLKDSTQKLLELINEFSNVAGYKINIHKFVTFLYTNSEIEEREYKKPHLLKLHPKKHLRINLIKEVKDLHAENYKTLIKETKDDLKKRNDIPCSWVGRILLKWQYHPKQSTDLM